MSTLKSLKLKWLLTFLMTLISILLGSAFSRIGDSFFQNVGILIGYKLLLTVCLLLLTSLIFLALYHRLALHENPQSIPVNSPAEKNKTIASEIQAKYERALNNLSMEEKEFLKRYFSNNTKVLLLHYKHPIASALEIQGILYQTSSGMINLKANFHIIPYAWTYLNEHPELLKST